MRAQKLQARLTAGAILAFASFAVTPLLPVRAESQHPVLQNVVPDSVIVAVNAKIHSINSETREVTLMSRSGASVTMTAGPNVRLEMLKAGDIVNAHYYRAVAFLLSDRGHPVPENEIAEIVGHNAGTPGGVGMRTTRISGLVVGIDPAGHSVDVVNPSGGGVYTIDVIDPDRQAMISSLKVGETITAVVSETLAVSIEPST